MLCHSVLAATVVALSCISSTYAASSAPIDAFIKKYHDNTLQSLPSSGSCNKNNIVPRREWGDLSSQTRLDYIRAIKCLTTKPSIIGADVAPGARNRYDDFQAVHIMYTTKIHATGMFFAWHRWFVYLFETALRNECGYTGYQPYWDWAKYADQPTGSNPLYDGSATSLSGNGKYIPNRNGTLQPFPIPVADPPAIYTAPGTGGGYIYQGPLVNWTMHLGPWYNQTVKNGIPVKPNPGPNALGYNPRPIIRDFNNTLLQPDATYTALANLLTNNTNIHTFSPAFFQGPHLAGHSFISGVDNDLFTSPGDPLFWFHHAQADRIYSIWQAQNFTDRQYALDGTLTLLNLPPTRNATLDDPMPFKWSPDVAIRKAMSPTQNGLCYIYA